MPRELVLLIPCLTSLALAASGIAQGAADATRSAQPDDQSGPAQPQRLWVYIGTYTGPKTGSQGIYRLEMDARTGRLGPPEVAVEVANPSFLAIHPTKRFMYAVGELADFQGKRSGAVSALALDPATGGVTLLNQQASGGLGPCHLTVDPAGQCVLVAHYSDGSVSVLPIDKDGRVGKPTSVIQHEGSGPDPKRQQGPHAHSVNLDAAGRFAFVADLGLDKVMVYRFDAGKGSLTANDPPAGVVAPGAGPRHFAFHPTGRFAYVINEMGCTVTAFAYDSDRGALRELQTVATLPDSFKDSNTTAEVQVHPSGRFLYGSNRGHDSIAIFALDQGSGRLTPLGHESTQGKTPRNFGLDPSGTWLIAANQNSDTLVVFRIDPQTGRLQPAGVTAPVPSPVCVKFVPVSR